MHGSLRVALVLLVLVASGATAAHVGPATSATAPSPPSPTTETAGPVVPVANSSGYLALPSDRIQTSRFDTVTLDVGGSMAVDNAEIHGRYGTTQLREAFARAETPAERRAVVNRSAARLDARIAKLTARERSALDAYNDGELSARAYLRELAEIHVAASSVQRTVDQLYTFDRAAGMPVEATRIAQMKSRLLPLSGPVREEVATAMAGGETSNLRVYIETSETGFVLSMTHEDQFSTHYTREAYYGDGFDDNWADRPITIDEFEQRLDELYPWVSENKDNSDSALTSEPYYSRAGVYAIAYNHPHGTISNRDLTVYYDAGTKEVFYEVQRLDVDALPTDSVAENTRNDLTVRLNATHADGPMSVVVTNAVTGERVTATVAVDGTPIGTAADGRLWTVAPRGTFTVTARSDGRNVTVTVPNFK